MISQEKKKNVLCLKPEQNCTICVQQCRAGDWEPDSLCLLVRDTSAKQRVCSFPTQIPGSEKTSAAPLGSDWISYRAVPGYNTNAAEVELHPAPPTYNSWISSIQTVRSIKELQSPRLTSHHHLSLYPSFMWISCVVIVGFHVLCRRRTHRCKNTSVPSGRPR